METLGYFISYQGNKIISKEKNNIRDISKATIFLEKQLKHDEATNYYRKALLIEPQNPGVHFNLGVALGNKGDLNEAIEHFREAVRLRPDCQPDPQCRFTKKA